MFNHLRPMHPAVFYEGFAAYVAGGDDAYDVNALRIGFKVSGL